MFDELLAVLEDEGLSPLPVAISSLKDQGSVDLVNQMIGQSDARLILNTTGFASNRAQQDSAQFISPFRKDIPVFQLILSSSSEADWQDYKQGLRSRDVAMQVVLPEMDGRIITRAISFKGEAYYSKRCQISIVGYKLHQERASFVAQLAKRYCALANKPNKQKRIALILANYPTKDGRIGNGVGLDTPASTINILKAMQGAGYPLNDIPQDGDALMKALLGAVTNNPNTLHQLPCWQSISVDDYLQYFQALPEASQQAVMQRWGEPQNDPKVRNGRIMLAGIRLGETFIGIQPARGFNLDLLANYHDPDLIPPHSYLAYYFWLRHSYQVDAIIHVGKHGNLEWLPGKGLGLSESCWPDIALGPMPHFYPFIVNDPGEGAQAKRRTQAAIIDHLMPPMTRAETYGELAEMEGLVDEYYQALGMDAGRESWLRKAIFKQLESTHLLEELQPASNKVADEDEILNELDTYLCEIKEAQIRQGLHILGELPGADKLADTLVALLRLPRSETITGQGILHNLAQDLSLDNFDPLQSNAEQWRGKLPGCLQSINNSACRTTADVRERLELLALQLVRDYVLGSHSGMPLLDELPRTREQLQWVKKSLHPVLKQSVHLEIESLLGGLSGKFIPPGASGAPTRGRLDTLPTGRNFFSVDNRAIPTLAAWKLGKKSAQALIERHLQEQGDYPKQLGLSVWGTATMRTGGDDIAQAFALMGVKPVWATGSNRVIDFEVIPTMQLARPRVDVTLRVSGFFRDAFPNVMKLYDAAVQAIALFDDVGEDNTIRQNIEARKATLMAKGMDEAQAQREASYRVFGSKPGAYGAGLQGLIDERCWENASDLAEAYLNWGGYAYGNQKGDGVGLKNEFQHRLSQLEAVVQNQDNREHDLLDSDDYYQFQGGMSNAVKQYSGKVPTVYHGDHSNPSSPKIRTLQEELNRVIRSRVLNPKWIESMRGHGYKGAFEMAATVDYLFAYDATTHLIADYQYQKVSDAFVFDKTNRAFLQKHNPNALEEMAERLLEATQRGLWQEPGDYAQALQDLLLEMDERQEGL
jgi:cobaltochelatase CobN